MVLQSLYVACCFLCLFIRMISKGHFASWATGGCQSRAPTPTAAPNAAVHQPAHWRAGRAKKRWRNAIRWHIDGSRWINHDKTRLVSGFQVLRIWFQYVLALLKRNLIGKRRTCDIKIRLIWYIIWSWWNSWHPSTSVSCRGWWPRRAFFVCDNWNIWTWGPSVETGRWKVNTKKGLSLVKTFKRVGLWNQRINI